ncbi:MAG: hypothetical protein KDA79_05980 [Planctomycetaceae bacterium]|nr:hypothetical protein [Planctomycetaceae bacterium]
MMTAVPAWSADNPPDYATDVYPVLRTYCSGCHNADEAGGELRLDDFALLMKGGSHGPAIVPGKPDESRLLQLVERKQKPFMPPADNERPKPAEIAILRDWIAAGAQRGTGIVDRFSLVTPEIKARGEVRRPISRIALHPEGTLLAIARYGQVEITTVKDRKTIQVLDQPAGNVNDVRFSADGSLLVAAAGEAGLFGEALLWSTSDWKLVRTVRGHNDSLFAAVLAPDGQTLATAGYDSAIRLWNVKTGEELHLLKGHNGPVFDLAFHPAGKILASASGDRTVKLWNVATGQRLDTLTQPEKDQYAVVFSPDGRSLAASGIDNRIRVWELTGEGREGTTLLRYARFAHNAPIIELAYSADGSRLATSAEDRTVKLWEAGEYNPLRTLPAQPDWATGLAFSPEGDRLWLGRLDGSLETADVGDITAPRGEQFVETRKPFKIDPRKVRSLDSAGHAAGTLASPGQADYYRFTLKQGETRIIETSAARKKWPTDTRIEVLHEDGRPVLRKLLRAVRDSWITFRPIDSRTVDVRVKNWEEMQLDQFMYLGGEVCRIYRMPQGPDSGFNFYPVNGQRRNYFDTSATIHAKEDPVYVVVPLEPEARIVGNGLPVFPLYYQNDDDGWRKLGTDSRLRFTAPADGTWLVRVTDVRGLGGEEYRYELEVRPPAPDFSVTVNGLKPVIPAASGQKISFKADRADDFAGPIEITIDHLPPGITAATPVTIQAGHHEAESVLRAAPDATAPTKEQWEAVTVTARALVDGKDIEKPLGNLGEIKLAAAPKVLVWLEPDPEARNTDPATGGIVIRPGTRTTAIVRIERNGADGPLRFDVENLPHGVIVADLGLNGITLLPGQTRRVIFLEADSQVPETTRPMFAICRNEGKQASAPLLLHVRQDAQARNGN